MTVKYFVISKISSKELLKYTKYKMIYHLKNWYKHCIKETFIKMVMTILFNGDKKNDHAKTKMFLLLENKSHFIQCTSWGINEENIS